MNNPWKIHGTKEETEGNFLKLKVAVEEKSIKAIRDIIASNVNCRSFIVRRGKENLYIRFFLEGFLILANAISEGESLDVLRVVHCYDLPEHIVIELMAAAYRMREGEFFKACEAAVFENKDLIIDKEVVPAIYHEMAAWSGEIEKDSQKAIEYNKQALGLARAGRFEIIELKIMFGLSYNKSRRDSNPLSQKERIGDFQNYKNRFRELGDDYDALRAEIEEARAIFNYSKTQNNRLEFVDNALDLVKSAHAESRRIGYVNALIQAKELLAKIYMELNKKSMAERFEKEAANLRREYDYQAPPLDKE